MSIYSIAAFELARWQTWIVPVVGVFCAVLVFVISKLCVRQPSFQPFVQGQAATLSMPESRPLPDTRGTPDPFEGGSVTERRSSPRRMGRRLRVYIQDNTSPTKPFEGWVMDRSMGGLCLETDRAIGRNSVLNVKSADADDSVPWVQVRIRRCKQEGKAWQVGCQFVRIPSWGVLLQFG